MLVELYVWLWTHFDAKVYFRKAAQGSALAALLILPLLYVNLNLVKQGFRPSQASLSIQIGKPGGVPEANEADDSR